MRIVKMTNPANSTVVELRYDNLDKPGKEVTIYQNGEWAGVYALEVADKGVANAKAQGWPVEDSNG